MVSGLVTSPCDQLRIFSGDARLMRIASKSAIVFCISNGLERNKVFLRFPRLYRRRLRPSVPVLSFRFSVLRKTGIEPCPSYGVESECRSGVIQNVFYSFSAPDPFSAATEN